MNDRADLYSAMMRAMDDGDIEYYEDLLDLYLEVCEDTGYEA